MQADNTAAVAAAVAATTTTPEESSSSLPPPVFEGSCFCRSVSWRLEGEPLISIYCHCTLCQRMNGAAFVHGLHFPLTSFTWTNPPHQAPSSTSSPSPSPLTQSKPTPTHSWIIYRCTTCHSYIGAFNPLKHIWSLKSSHLNRDPKTGLVMGFERIRPTAHCFYGTRMLDVPDGLPKWDGYENESRRLDLD